MPRLIDRPTLHFLLNDWLKLGELFARERYADHSAESAAALLDLAEKLAASQFLPHYKKADAVEPRLDADGVTVLPEVAQAVRRFGEAGFPATPFDATHGGLQGPDLLHNAIMGLFMAGNVATSAYSMLSIANARLIATFGTPAQIAAFAQPQIEGRWLGTMCLSEPQAGSSLADILTRAVADGEDDLGPRYRLSGNKMWISGGDHDITGNIVHLVLAKIADADGALPSGTKGISLFAVPKVLPDGARNDVVVAGLNHKMGYRATANCLLNFGEGGRYIPEGAAGAVGWMIGAPGQGLAIMFQMMNEARLSIGLGAAALGNRAHLLSVDYARERLQGRAPDSKQAAKQSQIIAHADVKRLLLAQKAYVEGGLGLVLYCSRLVDDHRTAPDTAAREEAHICLDLLTPVAKTWPSEYGLAANDIAIQIHGGYGYTRDFDVEQLYRDNRLNPIHEGTTGIQGIDLVGRKIRRDKGRALDVLGRRVAATVAAAKEDAELASFAAQVEAAFARARHVAATLIETPDDTRVMWNATAFLSGFGHVVVAWLWLDMARAALEKRTIDDALFPEGKLRACRFFIETELPRAYQWLAQADTMSDAASTMPEGAFG